MKKIYIVPNEEIAAAIRDEVEEKWKKKFRTSKEYKSNPYVIDTVYLKL